MKASVGLGVSLVVFAGDAVTVAVHVTAVAGFPGVKRRNPRAPRLAAPGEMGVPVILRSKNTKLGSYSLTYDAERRFNPFHAANSTYDWNKSGGAY